MKRNISVFILLILLASSFKYRTKARETNQPLLPGRLSNMLPAPAPEKTEFEKTLDQMQEANLNLANGNPELFKSMWLKNEEVTIFGADKNLELKGWQAIEQNLGQSVDSTVKVSDYNFEHIAANEGPDQAYLLQKEHYEMSNGDVRDLQVTVLFKKENDQWKIVHRHEDCVEPSQSEEPAN